MSAVMSSDKLAELHEVLEEQLRQDILVRLGEFGSLDFEGLKKKLKLADSAILSNQIEILLGLTVEGEHLLTLQGTLYGLTVKGHDVLDDLLTCPVLADDDYKEKLFGNLNQSKVKPKWFIPYWVTLIVSTIIVVGFVIPYFGNQSLNRRLFTVFLSLWLFGIAYYALDRPSTKKNKFMYIVILGFGLGCAFWMLGLILSVFVLRVPRTAEDALFYVLTILSFTLGPIAGYLIGKARNFKGPEQYIP
jgi:hypothetical protein